MTPQYQVRLVSNNGSSSPFVQVKKVSDEGSSSHFVARLFMGMLEFRNQLFLLGAEGPQLETMRGNFDKQYTPIYEALQAIRDAAIKVRDLVYFHLHAIKIGKAIKIGSNQYDILEVIDVPLSEAIDQLIDQSIIATKSGLQTMLKDQLNLEIGFFFQQEKEFKKGIENLQALGETDLAQYLQNIRDYWHSQLQELRVQHEHKGWSLKRLNYRLSGPQSVIVDLPIVLDMPVNEFAIKTANRILLFVENMMVYAMQRHCQFPIFVAEIPKESRDFRNPQRFRLAPRGLDPSQPWVITYREDMDFI
jgi:hypothetical protein